MTPTQEIRGMLQFFANAHLPPVLREMSNPFCELASWLASRTSGDPEAVSAMRKLLEAKDAAVRSCLYQPQEPVPVDRNTADDAPVTIEEPDAIKTMRNTHRINPDLNPLLGGVLAAYDAERTARIVVERRMKSALSAVQDPSVGWGEVQCILNGER